VATILTKSGRVYLSGRRSLLVPPIVLAKKKRDFDPKKFIATIGDGRKVVAFPKKQTIFTQGEAADSVFYIQAGKVRLTVISEIGKEATLAACGASLDSGTEKIV
jgi:CRP-like cAMP-binding protein